MKTKPDVCFDVYLLWTLNAKLGEFAKSNQPIPWVRVYQVTAGVTWTHRAHLQAGMQ